MRAPSTRTRRISTLSSAPVAVLLAGLMVWQGSNAAFTAETHNTGNNWETGSVAITDDDGGSAMFAVGNLVPDESGSKCIAVTATSSVVGEIRFYLDVLVANGLEDRLMVTIQRGAPGSFASCSGFEATATEPSQSMASLWADHNTYETGVLPWDKLAGEETQTYKISWVFDTTGMTEAQINALQGKNVGGTFEWELISN